MSIQSLKLQRFDDHDVTGHGGNHPELSLGPGEADMLSAKELGDGSARFSGRLGDGDGKWRLKVVSERPIQVMSLLSSPSGAITNLSR